jgi:hypothetical protein
VLVVGEGFDIRIAHEERTNSIHLGLRARAVAPSARWPAIAPARRERKCVPDLAAAEIKSEQTHRYVVEMPLYWTGMNGSGDTEPRSGRAAAAP